MNDLIKEKLDKFSSEIEVNKRKIESLNLRLEELKEQRDSGNIKNIVIKAFTLYIGFLLLAMCFPIASLSGLAYSTILMSLSFVLAHGFNNFKNRDKVKNPNSDLDEINCLISKAQLKNRNKSLDKAIKLIYKKILVKDNGETRDGVNISFKNNDNSMNNENDLNIQIDFLNALSAKQVFFELDDEIKKNCNKSIKLDNVIMIAFMTLAMFILPFITLNSMHAFTGLSKLITILIPLITSGIYTRQQKRSSEKIRKICDNYFNVLKLPDSIKEELTRNECEYLIEKQVENVALCENRLLEQEIKEHEISSDVIVPLKNIRDFQSSNKVVKEDEMSRKRILK